MSDAPQQISLIDVGRSDKPSFSIRRKIQGRQSLEIVIAFSGPVGSGVAETIDYIVRKLKDADYEIRTIKISNKIRDSFKKISTSPPPNINDKFNEFKRTLDEKHLDNLDKLKGYDKYNLLQDFGNLLRESFEPDILSQYAINDILLYRLEAAQPEYDKAIEQKKFTKDEVDLYKFTLEFYTPKKTVYIIDQLKNPAEVELLRDVYGDLFYLVGTICSEDERKRKLKHDENEITDEEVTKIMTRDRKEYEDHGQQLDKTLQLSDYFIKNVESNHSELEKQVNRFLDLIHRKGIITPTKDEYAMYIAYSAGLKSACLSRQVGACITDDSGQIIATGCNDVPKYGGGLYTSQDTPDHRCYNKGKKCYNDDYKKRRIVDQMTKILSEYKIQKIDEIISKLYKDTRIKDLIEFSRSIHAEMDALISLSKKGSISSENGTLYTTVYPCHNCARHIVAAGINRVVFIEPYEKSLARELHPDAISVETKEENKVFFEHFVGVSPRKYQDFFLANEERKDADGKLSEVDGYTLKPKIHGYLDSYRTMEVKVTEHFNTTPLKEAK